MIKIEFTIALLFTLKMKGTNSKNAVTKGFIEGQF